MLLYFLSTLLSFFPIQYQSSHYQYCGKEHQRRAVTSSKWKLTYNSTATLGQTVSIFVNIPKTPEEAYYLKIRPYEFALTDFDRGSAEVYLQSKEDSVIFNSCVNFFFADSAKCNLPFFEKIGVIPLDKTPSSLARRILHFQFQQNKIKVFLEILKDLKWLLLLWIGSGIGLLIFKRHFQKY